MPSVLDVDPEHYAAASASMGVDLAPGLANAVAALTRGLAGSGTMAGHDGGGRAWGEQYDLAAPQALAAIAAVERASLKLATLLQHTGFNHAEAESMSTAQRNGGTPDTLQYSGSRQVTSVCGQAPTATGGTGDYPAEWSLIRAGVGFEWPDGSPGKLRTAAAAWSTAAKTIAGLEIYVDHAVAAINLQQSPEVADAVTVCTGMRAHLATVSKACATIASSCGDLATSIESAHQKAIHAMKVLVALSTGTQVLGAIGAIFSLGISEALSQAVETLEIASVRSKVIEILSALAIRARTAELALSSMETEVAQVEPLLKPVLDSTVVTAETTAVPTMSAMTAAESAEVAAEARLAADAGAAHVDLQAAEDAGGHTILEHVGKTDDYLMRRKKVSYASTFPDLDTAERLTEMNLEMKSAEVDDWLKSTRYKLVISSPADASAGRIYDPSTGSFVTPTRVTTVLLRDGKGGYFLRTSFPDV